jgi:hypothetical protein
MEHGGPKQKSERDRIRQQRGAARKEQIRAIRRIVKAWTDGADAAASMAEIGRILRSEGRP